MEARWAGWCQEGEEHCHCVRWCPACCLLPTLPCRCCTVPSSPLHLITWPCAAPHPLGGRCRGVAAAGAAAGSGAGLHIHAQRPAVLPRPGRPGSCGGGSGRGVMRRRRLLLSQRCCWCAATHVRTASASCCTEEVRNRCSCRKEGSGLIGREQGRRVTERKRKGSAQCVSVAGMSQEEACLAYLFESVYLAYQRLYLVCAPA